MRISDATAGFLADRRRRDCLPRTLVFYECQTRYLRDWLATRGVESVEALTAEHARGYIESLQARDPSLSPVTVRKWATATRTFLLWLFRSEATRENLARQVPVPRARQRLPKALSAEQAGRLLRGPLNERDQAIVTLLLDTGLRLAEICALDMDDVDTASGTILVRCGKGAKQRMVVFAEAALASLQQWQAVRARLALRDAQALFTSRTGDRLTPSGLYKAIARIGRACDVDVSPHKLRHSFATLYLDGGGAIQDLADLLGHEHIATTMLYTRISTQSLRRKHGLASPANALTKG